MVAEVSPAESAPEVDTEETGKASAAIEGAGELEESAATEESIAAEEGAAEEESQPAGAEGAEDDAVREAEAVAFGSPPFDAGPTQQPAPEVPAPTGGEPRAQAEARRLPGGPPSPHGSQALPSVDVPVRRAFVLTIEPAGGGTAASIPLQFVDASLETELAIDASSSGVSFSLSRYAPSVVIQERIVAARPGEAAPPAIRVKLKTRMRLYETWLVPGSPVLGHAALSAAIIEYLPALDREELKATENLLYKLNDGAPKIVLREKTTGKRHLLPAEQGTSGTVESLGYTIEVLRALNCFASDTGTGQVIEKDSRPLNPAVQVKVSFPGGTRTAWLFSLLPEFSRGAEDDLATLRYIRPIEGHPHERAEITIVDAASGPLTVYVGSQAETYRLELSPGSPVKVSTFEIELAERIPAARIEQELVEESGPGAPAVLLGWRGSVGDDARWVPVGATEEIRIGGQIFWARLAEVDASKTDPHGAVAPSRGMPVGHPKVDGAGAGPSPESAVAPHGNVGSSPGR